MALQVWLPLNDDLHNQGLSDVTIASNSGTSMVATGKIGSCTKVTTGIGLGYAPDFNNNGLSFGGWFKFNQAEINTVISGKTYSSTASTPTGQLIGNSSYGGIGLVWTGNNYYSSNSFTSMSVFATLRTSSVNKSTSAITIQFDTWVHIMLTWNPITHILSLYKDGNLINSQTFNSFSDGVSRVLTLNYQAIYGGNGPSASIPFYANDIRIYNHCLSPKEVEEIAKGLVLHYKLDNNGMGGDNLMLGTKMSEVPNSSSDTPLRYYNTNASNCTVHDNQVTIILNSTANLGISFIRSASEINLDSNEYYTLSCEAKTSRNGAQLSIGTSYYNTSGNGVWRGGTNKQPFSSLNKWERFSLTFKPDADTDRISYCFTATGVSKGTDTLEIRHCKLEKGNIATLWAPAPEEMEDNNIIYDSSGYNNNGEIINDLQIISASPRYSVATNLTTTSSHIHVSNLSVAGFSNSYSFTWWGNCSTYSGKMMWGFSDGVRLNGIYNGNLWNTGDGSNNPLYIPGTTTQVSAPSINVWHHFAMVGNGTLCLVYLDGILWGQAKTYKTISGTSIYFNGWLNNTSYTLANTKLSDFRIYSTALSAAQVKELYNTSMVVDSNGNIKPREVAEL